MPSMAQEKGKKSKKVHCYSFVVDIEDLRQAQVDKISPFLQAMAWDRAIQAVILATLMSIALTAAAVYTPPECAVP